MKPITLLSLVNFSEAQLQRLRSISPRLEVHQVPHASVDDLPPELVADVEILYGWGKSVVQAHRFPRLRWLQSHSAGIDFLQETPVWRRDVLISSLNGVHAAPMAEYVLTMMLAFRWRLPLMRQLQTQRQWPEDRWQLFAQPELREMTVGIVGYGAIGRELGRLARGLGMRVLATNRAGQRTPFAGYCQPGTGDADALIPERLYATRDLTQMLPQCDFVALLAPLTAQTRHWFSAEIFAAMKPGAVFINLSRGGLVVEPDLVAALQSGHLGGAGLDVFAQEPLPAGSPLWSMPNVIISPHVSGFTPHYDDRAIELFSENLRRYLQGQPLLNQVDRQRGY
ncbi:MAG: D-2-hydroxyacid dehydrogenase [Chloroflexi bacterium]|nr:D-2-hydroxyacid dehydrogenase [Chloroflexota bacterium]